MSLEGKSKTVLSFVIVFAVVIFAVYYGLTRSGTQQEAVLDTNKPLTDKPLTEQVDQPVVKQENKIMDTKLETQTIIEGSGAVAVSGDNVSVNYTGMLTNGTKFDSNVDPAFKHVQPFTFSLGAGQVIKGWDQGVAGMKIGEKRKLTIPADLAYGTQSPSPLIPANSTLVFEVELLSINK